MVIVGVDVNHKNDDKQSKQEGDSDVLIPGTTTERCRDETVAHLCITQTGGGSPADARFH